MSNISINYLDIMNLIGSQFDFIKQSNDSYENINYIIGDEQIFSKISKESPYNVYIAVSFGQASTNFGQAVLPVTINVLGLNNEIELTQQFLSDYVAKYNRDNTSGIIQLYLTPSVVLNFANIREGYRSLFTLNGTFLMGSSNAILETLTYGTGQDAVTVDVIAFNDSFETNLNPQPYYNNKGRLKSYGDFVSYSFSIVTYPDYTNQLIKDLWSTKFDTTNSVENVIFKFSVSFSGSLTGFTNWNFHLKTCTFDQKIGEIPVVTAVFTL